MAKTFVKKNLENVSNDSIVETEIQSASFSQGEGIVRARAYENIQVGVNHFTVNNAPDDPKLLKEEIKFLANRVSEFLLILTHRLKKYKDEQLYLQDDYPDFKAWIEGELTITRTTVYNYIWSLEEFGVQTFEHVGISKLIALLKTVRSFPQDKDLLVQKAQELSTRDLNKYIRQNYFITRQETEEEGDFLENAWYDSEDEVVNHYSSFLRKGMKPKTVNEMIRGLVNLRIVQEPKNKELIKIKQILSKL